MLTHLKQYYYVHSKLINFIGLYYNFRSFVTEKGDNVVLWVYEFAYTLLRLIK